MTNEVVVLLTESEARILTDRIKTAVEHTWMLLEEAHQRRAWAALQYRTWEQYVKAEFDMSRSRSYELLDHAQVVRAIEDASGMSGIPDIRPYDSEFLKPHLAEVAETVRRRTNGAPREQVEEIVREVVREERTRIQHKRDEGRPIAELNKRYAPEGFDPNADEERIEVTHRLYDAMHNLAQMPSVGEVIAQIPDYQHYRFAELGRAVAWLNKFAEKWEKTA